MRVAIVYDRVNKWGGAERVLLALHEIFPEAPLFTSVYHPSSAPWAEVFPDIHTSFLNKFSPLRKRHEILAPFMPQAFESFKFDPFDVVISVTSEAAKGIITSPNTLHICYCLTPTRYLWSGYDSYFTLPFHKALTKPVVDYLKKWDKVAAKRPDVMVAISTEVQGRIKKYYGRESQVIHPPMTLPKRGKRTGRLGNYYLVVSRLVPYKRVDLAVEAFNALGLPLYIVGTGSEEGKLKRKAKRNVKFLGQLTERRLFHYYDKAQALVMPQEEDFGLVALEAQNFGVPVIAFKAGGALDTVIDGITGVFFEAQTPESLRRAIKRFGSLEFDKGKLTQNVKRFSKERFKKEINNLIVACLK